MSRIGRKFLALSLVLAVSSGLGACGGGSGDGGDAGGDPIDASPLPDAVVCEPPPSDQDGDNIADQDEGPPGFDFDTDGTPDLMDTDSDGDGIDDVVEAGDDNRCTPPRNTDGVGAPDFRELDADANGIPDADETDADLDEDGFKAFQDEDDDGDNIDDVDEFGGDPLAPVDFDDDGTPDFLDTDSDGDTVLDKYEGILDDDGDDLPAYHDLDADGDGRPDAIEAGDGLAPRDTDGDNLYDFLDIDADNDGLPDDREDVNRDGVVDPGESDPLDYDTDNDTFPDVVEWAAGTDPTDPTSVIDPGDFYFILPHFGTEQTDDLDFDTDIIKADVFFEVDTTGSMGGTISTLQTSLVSMVEDISLEVPNVAMGAAWFKDFPVSPFGSSGDLPFRLTARITTIVADVQTGLNQFAASGGGDGPESGMESLYQAVTGEGLSWTVAQPGAVPKFNPLVGFDALKGHGLIGGAGFREGALPIIVHATDIEFHEASDPGDYWATGIAQAHTRDQAVNAAKALGARFIGVTSSVTAEAALKEIARETGAVVPPEAWGPGETNCHTGEGGSERPPDATGLCPLVFAMASGGTGIDDQVVDAIKALVQYGSIDVTALAVSDPFALPLVDTSRFIASITPVPPAPPGSTIDGDAFRDVQPGSPIQFRVRARNTTVESKREAQLFRVTIRVMGDGVTTLDEREVFVIVPGGGTDL